MGYQLPAQPKTVVFDGKKKSVADDFVKGSKYWGQTVTYVDKSGYSTTNPNMLLPLTPYTMNESNNQFGGGLTTAQKEKAEKEKKGCELFLKTMQELDNELKGKKKPTSKSSNNPFVPR